MAGFPWGKIISATADEVADFGPNAARVKALLSMIPELSTDAKAVAGRARNVSRGSYIGSMLRNDDAYEGALNAANRNNLVDVFDNAQNAAASIAARGADATFNRAAWDAAPAEALAGLINPQTYRNLTGPLAAGRAFDLRRASAPESFTDIVYNLSGMGQITGPRDIGIARRLSMQSPTFTQLVMSFTEDGMSLGDAMSAARALGL